MPKELILFEPGHTGHRLQYIANCLDAFAGCGKDIVFVTHANTPISDEYGTLLEGKENQFTLKLIAEPKPAQSWSKLKYTIEFWKILQMHKGATIFIPYLDYIFYHYGLVAMILGFKHDICGIIFRGDFAYDIPNSWKMRIKRFVANRITASCAFKKIFVIDDLLFNYFKERGLTTNNHVAFCPDPVDMDFPYPDTASARKAFGLPVEAKIIGTLGVLDKRKGVDRLIEGFAAMQPKPNEYLLLVGKQKGEVETLLSELKDQHKSIWNQVISINRFVTQTDFLGYLMAMDIVTVIYPNHIGPASILIRAAVAGKQIIASEFGWVGYMGQQIGNCQIATEKNINNLIKSAFKNKEHPCPEMVNESVIKKYSLTAFKSALS